MPGDDARAFLLTASGLQSRTVELNGQPLAADETGALPDLTSLARAVSRGGDLQLPHHALLFAVLPDAGAAACR